jgi:hypothetical protein
MKFDRLNLIRIIVLNLVFSIPLIGLTHAGSWVWQNPFPQGNHLYGIWGSAANDVFIVGANGAILHYSGGTYHMMPSGTTNDLSGVWGSSGSDVFAVGSGGKILHYDGNTWTSMVSGTTNNL